MGRVLLEEEIVILYEEEVVVLLIEGFGVIRCAAIFFYRDLGYKIHSAGNHESSVE